MSLNLLLGFFIASFEASNLSTLEPEPRYSCQRILDAFDVAAADVEKVDGTVWFLRFLNKKALLGAPGIATGSKDATRGSSY